MSDRKDERPELSPSAQRFVEHLAENFEPDPPDAARSRAFDAALFERVETPVRQPRWKPALVAAAVGAAIGWLLMPPAVSPPDPAETIAAVDTERWAEDLVEAATWQSELFTASGVEDLETMDDDEFLPDDYLAIGGFFLDG